MLTNILAKHSILDQIKRAELNRVLHETKRLVCLCCRVHTGNNLSDLVQQECTPEHEEKYKQLFSKNLMEDKQKIKENIKLLKEENMIRKSYEIVETRTFKIIVLIHFSESGYFQESWFRHQYCLVYWALIFHSKEKMWRRDNQTHCIGYQRSTSATYWTETGAFKAQGYFRASQYKGLLKNKISGIAKILNSVQLLSTASRILRIIHHRLSSQTDIEWS